MEAREVAQQFRILGALGKDLAWVPSTTLLISGVVFWSPPVPGMYMVHISVCRQNIHTHKNLIENVFELDNKVIVG